MPRRSRSRSPQNRRRHSDGEREHRRREEERQRKSSQSEDKIERMEVDTKPRRRKFEENPKQISPIRSNDRPRDDGESRRRERGDLKDAPEERGKDRAEERRGRGEERRRGQEREEGRGGRERGEEGEGQDNRTDKFRNERMDHPPRSSDRPRSRWDTDSDRDQRQQWREERRGRGRGDRRGGWIRGSWREEERRKQPPTGEEENEGEEEDAERDSRLLNSLMDPQDVPRKGFFFEHDDRETIDSHRQAPRRRFSETRSPSNHAPSWRGRGEDQGRREPRHHSYSGEDRTWRGEDRNWRGDDRSWRGDRDYRRRRDRRGPGNYDNRREGEERRMRSPARWRHDRFEDELEDDAAKTAESKDQKSSADGMWGHDKYEELVKMEA